MKPSNCLEKLAHMMFDNTRIVRVCALPLALLLASSPVLVSGCDSSKPSSDDKAQQESAKDPQKGKTKPDPEVSKQLQIVENNKASVSERMDAAAKIGGKGKAGFAQVRASWDNHRKKEDRFTRTMLIVAAGGMGEPGVELLHSGMSDDQKLVRDQTCEQLVKNADHVVKDEKRRTKIVGLLKIRKSEPVCYKALVAIAVARKKLDGE